MTMDPLRNPAIALRHRCDYCGAEPGENCHDNTRDIVLELPHYSRTPSPVSVPGQSDTDG